LYSNTYSLSRCQEIEKNKEEASAEREREREKSLSRRQRPLKNVLPISPITLTQPQENASVTSPSHEFSPPPPPPLGSLYHIHI